MTNRPDLETIAAALKREYEDAEDFYTSEIQEEVDAANRYYDGKPFGDENTDRSQIVLPVVQEVIDYAVPSVKRPFLAGERVIEFEATEEDDETGADEATDAVQYNFMREQDGPRILHDWLQSGLLEIIAPIKAVCETEEKVARLSYKADVEQAQAYEAGILGLPEGEEIEDVEEYEPTPEEIEEAQANGLLPPQFLVHVKRTKIVKRFRDVPIPLPEFRFSRNAGHEDGADYLAHVCLKTRSELVEMGFDRDQVDELPIADHLDLVESHIDEDRWRDTSELPHELQTVLLCEEYARMDVDDDGIAERVKVFRVGNEILRDAETGKPSIETIEEHPFVVFCPFPRAHRLVGNSLANKAMDLQRVESVISRQMMDGMYLANMPRPLVDMGSQHAGQTLEDILRPIPGSPIRYSGPNPPQPFQAGLDVSKSLTVLEHWKGERETRTGITRLNQGLDAETLNKTATGAVLLSAAGQQIEEDMARTFGDAFGRLMGKKYRLMKAEGATFSMKAQGKYVTVNAANWPDEYRLIVRVGLGSGRKEQKLQYLFALGDVMRQGFEMGMVTKRGLFRYGSELIDAMQLGQGDDYFENPENAPPEQEQPDPAMMEAQAKMQAEQMKVQAKAQGDQMNAQARMQSDTFKAQADLQAKRERMAEEAQLRREEMDREAELEVLRMATDAHVKRANIDDTAPGGDLSR